MFKEDFMNVALKEARLAFDLGEVPVGAAIFKNGILLSKSHNLKETKNVCIFHAEILAIIKASKKLKNWRLSGCSMFVTLEPCIMCFGAIIDTRINHLYFGAYDEKKGALSSNINFVDVSNYNLNVKGGILESQCSEIMKKFFEKIRKNSYI